MLLKMERIVAHCFIILSFVVIALSAGLPQLTISQCQGNPINWKAAANTSEVPFKLASCSGYAIQSTTVFACWDNSYLQFHFEAVDNNIYSPYTECNQDLYNDGESIFLIIF